MSSSALSLCSTGQHPQLLDTDMLGTWHPQTFPEAAFRLAMLPPASPLRWDMHAQTPPRQLSTEDAAQRSLAWVVPEQLFQL